MTYNGFTNYVRWCTNFENSALYLGRNLKYCACRTLHKLYAKLISHIIMSACFFLRFEMFKINADCLKNLIE